MTNRLLTLKAAIIYAGKDLAHLVLRRKIIREQINGALMKYVLNELPTRIIHRLSVLLLSVTVVKLMTSVRLAPFTH